MPEPDDFLPMSPRDFEILLVLGEGPLHAYGIARAVEQRPQTGVRLEIGSLYRVLTRLTAWGLIEDAGRVARSPAPPTGKEASRRYYQRTTLGQAVAGRELERLRAVVDLADRGVLGVHQGRG